MTIQNEADLKALQRVGHIVARVLEAMLDRLEPGMNLSAQYEHTMVITRGEPIVVTRMH